MTENAVVPLRQPEETRDALTEVLRVGARQLLAEAIEAEVGSFLAEYQQERGEAGGHDRRAAWPTVR